MEAVTLRGSIVSHLCTERRSLCAGGARGERGVGAGRS